MSPAGDPDPTREDADETAMRCAGCGAKVGSTVLTGVLDELEVYAREDVRIGLKDADDAALLKIPAGRSLVQSVDGFRAFTGDLHLFGRIALVHAASDLYAMDAEPHSALVNVTLPYAEKHLVANDLRQLMGGIAEEARRLQITLLGGHTSEGLETAVSVTMNGLTGNDSVFRKAGLRPGNGLILAKPLGTGVILAADMHLKAKGSWVDEVFDGMLQSNAEAARVLAQAGIPAVTDVTGFGLAGHLVEMLEASGTGAEIDSRTATSIRRRRGLSGRRRGKHPGAVKPRTSAEKVARGGRPRRGGRHPLRSPDLGRSTGRCSPARNRSSDPKTP